MGSQGMPVSESHPAQGCGCPRAREGQGSEGRGTKGEGRGTMTSYSRRRSILALVLAGSERGRRRRRRRRRRQRRISRFRGPLAIGSLRSPGFSLARRCVHVYVHVHGYNAPALHPGRGGVCIWGPITALISDQSQEAALWACGRVGVRASPSECHAAHGDTGRRRALTRLWFCMCV